MKRIVGIQQRRPSWAKALIVAELHEDQSDLMTDYHAHRTVTRVALAWSRHTRDLFPEMRKAAALFPETQHLGPGCGQYKCKIVIASPENFSNGNGSYMHAGERSPWHSELYPEGSDQFSGVQFTRRDEAERFLETAPEPEPITMSGTDPLITARFKWELFEEKIEHREKYSMGAGYYLKAGFSDWDGWAVEKQPYSLPDELGEVYVPPVEVKP